MIQTYKKGKDISIIIWGTFWGFGYSNANIVVRESLQNGYGTALPAVMGLASVCQPIAFRIVSSASITLRKDSIF